VVLYKIFHELVEIFLKKREYQLMKRKNRLNRIDILSEIYSKAGNTEFITMYDLETETGLSGSELRPMLEDLKEELLIVEHPEGFQISDNGMHFCKTRWA